jgi:hypothetical protein
MRLEARRAAGLICSDEVLGVPGSWATLADNAEVLGAMPTVPICQPWEMSGCNMFMPRDCWQRSPCPEVASREPTPLISISGISRPMITCLSGASRRNTSCCRTPAPVCTVSAPFSNNLVFKEIIYMIILICSKCRRKHLSETLLSMPQMRMTWPLLKVCGVWA